MAGAETAGVSGALLLAAAGVVVAEGWLLVACWRRRSVLGGVCALTGMPLIAFALASGLTGEPGRGALIISVVVLSIGIVLLGLGQTVQRLLDKEPEEGV